jgi:hypothetical protein
MDIGDSQMFVRKPFNELRKVDVNTLHVRMEDKRTIHMDEDTRLIMAILVMSTNIASLLQYDHFFASSVGHVPSGESRSKA